MSSTLSASNREEFKILNLPRSKYLGLKPNAALAGTFSFHSDSIILSLKSLDKDAGKAESTSTLIAPPPASVINGFLFRTEDWAKGFGKSPQATSNEISPKRTVVATILGNASHQHANQTEED